jgi:hypothetical protein
VSRVILLCTCLALVRSPAAEPRDFVFPIFSTATVKYDKPGFFGGPEEQTQVQAGTCFLLESGEAGKVAVITAAHCVRFPAQGTVPAEVKGVEVVPGSWECLVDGLALPVSMSEVKFDKEKGDADIAVIRLSPADLSVLDFNSKPKRFRSRAPKVGEQVKLWGYPVARVNKDLETIGAPTSITLEITQVNQNHVISLRLIDGQQLEGGFSGGPLVAVKDDLVVGVATSMSPNGDGNKRNIGFGRSIELINKIDK